jgi:NDP-sugar pyrophosphorylase family protein
MKAIILAGGLGSRLKPFTQTIPKPLLPLGEKAILEVQLERLKHYGFDEIYIATNYKSGYIEKFIGDGSRYGVNLTISREEKKLGTAGPLSLLKESLTEPFLVMNGDILSLIDLNDFYQFAIDKKTILSVVIKKEITPYLFGNIFFKGDYVTGIEEKPDIVRFIIAGIYVMRPSIFKFIPDNTFFGMDLLMNDLLKNEKKISKYELKEYWLDIGRVDDYQKAQDFYQKHFERK